MIPSILVALLSLNGLGAVQATDSPPVDADEDKVVVLDDVEVTARRGRTKIRPEQEYDAGQIDAQGAYDIGEVMRNTASSFGPGQEPVVIINGVRVPNPSLYYGLPPDALERLEVLPAGSAAAYGGPSSGRVINLVTQRRFQSRDGQLTASAPTQGGLAQGRANARHSRLRDSDLFNVTVSMVGASALRADERPDYLIDQPGSEGVTLTPETRFLSAGAALGRSFGDWTASLNLNADTAVSRSTSRGQDGLVDLRSETDSVRLDSGLGGRLMDWSVRLNLNAQATESAAEGSMSSTTQGRNLTGSLAADRQLPGLSAGPITANLSATAGRSTTDVRAGDAPSRFSNTTAAWTGQASIPLLAQSDQTEGRFRIPGQANLTLGAGANRNAVGGGGSVDVGLGWQPLEVVRLNAAWRRDVSAPGDIDRFAPLREGPSVVVYDFRTAEAVEVQTVLGGNPDLRFATNQSADFNLSVGPVSPWGITANVNLSRSQARNGLSTSLQPTPETEAAFPDRFVRDETGRLVRIDQRPFNTTASDTDRLSANLSLLPASGSPDGRRASLAIDLSYMGLLRDRVDYGAGLPVMDRLAGDGGGASRHGLTATVRHQRGPWVAEVSGRWTQAYRSRRTTGLDSTEDLLIDAFQALDAKISYMFVGVVPSGGSGPPRRGAGARVELAVLNLSDERPDARFADGRRAPGYGRDDRDPMGRRVQLTLSKRF